MTNARFATAVLWMAGLSFVGFGLWAFLDPHSFYEGLAPFEPYNRHFIHDIGAFQVGIGVALLAATRWNDAPFAALTGAAAGAAMHVASHVIDDEHGGNEGDIAVFSAMAALLVAGAVARWRAAELHA